MVNETRDEEFVRRLVALRKKKGWTQADVRRALADRGLPVTKQSISNWELGRFKPVREYAIALADMLNVTLEYLLAGDRSVDSARVVAVRGFMNEMADEEQALIENLVKNLYEMKVLKKPPSP